MVSMPIRGDLRVGDIYIVNSNYICKWEWDSGTGRKSWPKPNEDFSADVMIRWGWVGEERICRCCCEGYIWRRLGGFVEIFEKIVKEEEGLKMLMRRLWRRLRGFENVHSSLPTRTNILWSPASISPLILPASSQTHSTYSHWTLFGDPPNPAP